MDTCRTCGEFPQGDNQLSEHLQELAEIYFNLTSIKLLPEEDSNRQRICEECHSKLLEYDRFRSVCLQVHYRLTKIKSEAHEIPDIIAVEVECLPNVVELKAEELDFSDTELAAADAPEDDDILEDDSSTEKDQSSEIESEDEKPVVLPKKKRIRRKPGDVLPVYPCDRCSSKFRSEARFEAHKRTHDGLKPWVCKICGVEFIKEHSLSLHTNQKHSDNKRTFPCDFPGCTSVYSHKQGMQFHRLKHDPNFVKPPYVRPKRASCEHCGKIYSDRRALRKHMYVHTGERPPRPPGEQLTCLICDKIFAHKDSLRQHQSRIHNPDYYASLSAVICDICGKTFTTNGALKKHKFIHNPSEMPFMCEICDKKFPTSNKLKEHTMRHEGVKRHTCPHCGLRKITMHELNNHIKTVHIKTMRNCDYCSSKFGSTNALNIHVKTVHLGLKPFNCTTCGMAFGRSDHLKRHMKGHARGTIPVNNAPKHVPTIDRT